MYKRACVTMAKRHPALHLFAIAVPFLAVCHADFGKRDPPGSARPFQGRPSQSAASATADRGTRNTADASHGILDDDFNFEDKLSELTGLEDMISRFDDRSSEGDDAREDSQRNDYEFDDRSDDDEPRDEDRRDELHFSSAGDKGALYDAYNQLHTLAQVRCTLHIVKLPIRRSMWS